MDTIQTYSKERLDEVCFMTGLHDYPSAIHFLCRYYLDQFGYSGAFPTLHQAETQEELEEESYPAYCDREEVEL